MVHATRRGHKRYESEGEHRIKTERKRTSVLLTNDPSSNKVGTSEILSPCEMLPRNFPIFQSFISIHENANFSIGFAIDFAVAINRNAVNYFQEPPHANHVSIIAFVPLVIHGFT